MLDTNICIHVIKRRSLALLDRFNEHAGELALSSITLAELYLGAEKSSRPTDNLRTIEAFVARLDVLVFGAEAAAIYGRLRSDLERMGRPAGALDMLIGAHARSVGSILVTNNRREFDRVPGLVVEDWLAT